MRVLLGGMLLVIGCSSSSSTSSPSSTSGPEEFSQKYAATFCGGLAPCCAAAGAQHDVDACKEIKALSVSAPSAKHFDAAAAEACLNAVAAQAATCNEASNVPDCKRVFFGDVAPGQKCSRFSDCERPANGYATCYGDDDICEAHVPAAIGEPCGLDAPAFTFRECEFDAALYCSKVTGTCQARKAAGESCDVAVEECVLGFFCGGTCQPQLATGAACDIVGEQCAGGFCNNNTKQCSVPNACVGP